MHNVESMGSRALFPLSPHSRVYAQMNAEIEEIEVRGGERERKERSI
jgi:hypothetical protein